MRPAVKVARIAGASRHSRLETEPSDPEDLDRLNDLLDVIVIELRRAGRRKRLGHESYGTTRQKRK